MRPQGHRPGGPLRRAGEGEGRGRPRGGPRGGARPRRGPGAQGVHLSTARPAAVRPEMQRSMLDILACPIDKHHPLDLFVVSERAEVDEGALRCSSCSRFYPIIDSIPIMLPDELRDKKGDMDFLRRNAGALPEDITRRAQPWHL